MPTKKTKKTSTKKTSNTKKRVAVHKKTAKKKIDTLASVLPETSHSTVRIAQVRWATFVTSELAVIIAGIVFFVLLAGSGYLWLTFKDTGGSTANTYTSDKAADDSIFQDDDTVDASRTHSGPVPALRIYAGKDRGGILNQLAAKLQTSPDQMTARILLYDGAYVSGQYSLSPSEEESDYRILDSDFYAVMYNGAWSVVYANYGQPSCALLAQYRFPADMTYGCQENIETQKWSDQAEEALLQTIDAKYQSDTDYLGGYITTLTGDYARGVIDMFDGYQHQFFAKRQQDRWNLVYDSPEPFDCKVIAQSGIPQTLFGSSCYLEYELIRPKN